MATVLQHYFTQVATLPVYIRSIMDPDTPCVFMPASSDADSYRELVTKAYICSNSDSDAKPTFNMYSPRVNIVEIVQEAQYRLLKKGEQNVITTGFKLGSFGRNNPSDRQVIDTGRNTIVTAFQGPEWTTLAANIGTDAMIHLLTETSIFLPLPNDCLCQLTGRPILAMKKAQNSISVTRLTTRGTKRRLLQSPEGEKVSKRPKLAEIAVVAQKHVINSPADLSLPRHRVFYSRPSYIPNSPRLAVGFSPSHIFNQLSPRTLVAEYDAKEQFKKARALLRWIFPRQYKLPNAFTQATYKPPDYSTSSMKFQPLKTPKRLKSIVNLFEKMLWRHSKCNYEALKNVACPSKLPKGRDRRVPQDVILEVMSEKSETSFQLKSQRSEGDTSFDSQGQRIQPHGLTQAVESAEKQRHFTDYCCTHDEVVRYVILVTKNVVPDEIWGTKSNRKLIEKAIWRIVTSRRFETITLHEVLQSFSTSECDWLIPEGTDQKRIPVTDTLKRRELLEDFLYWFLDSFVLSLLQNTFYITDSAAFRKKTLYFSHEDWKALCAPLLQNLKKNTFEKMTKEEAEIVLQQRQLGYSFVRLLPKETGVRPIVNLRRKQGKVGLSINQVLGAAFSILTYEKESQRSRVGASVFGPDEIYTRLREYKSRLAGNNGNDTTLPRLYFVKVDVKACFDTIDQSKLLEILRELISEESYLIQRYGRISDTNGYLRRKYQTRAVTEADSACFLQTARELASALRGTIFADQGDYRRRKKADILHLLAEHITENIVKIGGQYYKQIVGIPQGSVISTLLCSFFYGDLERRHGGNFLKEGTSTLLRNVDDYLYITTSLPAAKRFLESMESGHPEYGCFISPDKTKINFDHGVDIMQTIGSDQTCFPWCGYLINMSDLSVSVEYRYQGHFLGDSLTVNQGRRPGVAFYNKMMMFAKCRSHPIYTDLALNGEHVVYLNIYQNFLICAMRMHAYIQDWGISVGKGLRLLQRTITDTLCRSYAAIRGRKSTGIAKKNGAHIDVNKRTVFWLGMHAFHAILSSKPCRYHKLLKFLLSALVRYGGRHTEARYRRITREGLAGLAEIYF